MNIDNWKEIEQNSLYWYDSAPWPCKPEAAGVLGHESDGFPDLWMTTPAHSESSNPSIEETGDNICFLVLAFQHFYLTQLLLAVYNPRVWRPGHEALLERVYVEVRTLFFPVLAKYCWFLR